MIDKQNNTQVVLTLQDNRRLRMMAASKNRSAKNLLSELIGREWVDSPLSKLENENEEAVHASTTANVGEDA